LALSHQPNLILEAVGKGSLLLGEIEIEIEIEIES